MKKGDSKVRIIITSRNNEKIIQDCLDNIYKQTYKNFSVTLIDDASTDGTVEIARTLFPQAKIIRNKTAKGPSQNRNTAVLESNEEFIFFMDSDAFPSEDFLEKSVKILESNEKIGILGGKIYFGKPSNDYRNEIQSVGGYMHIGGITGSYKEPEIDNSEYIWLPSCAYVARREVFDKVGGFDGEFFYLFEDNDLCWRTIIAGYKVLYSSRLVCFHLHSSTAKSVFKNSKIAYLTKRNKMLMLIKNYEIWSVVKYFPIILLTVFLELIWLKNPAAVLKGNLSFLGSLSHIRAERKKIKKYRKISDKYIVGRLIEKNLFRTIQLVLNNGYSKK